MNALKNILETEEKIMYQNNVLLNKMMEIQKNNLNNINVNAIS